MHDYYPSFLSPGCPKRGGRVFLSLETGSVFDNPKALDTSRIHNKYTTSAPLAPNGTCNYLTFNVESTSCVLRYNNLMTRLLGLIVLFAGFACAQNRVYELRTYTCNEGKLEALKARFRDHTIELFKRHGIESVGYWIPQDPEKSKTTLIYIIRSEA